MTSRRNPSDTAVASTNLPVDPNANVAGTNTPVDPSTTLGSSEEPEWKGPARDTYPLAHGPNPDHLEQQAVASHTREEPPAAPPAEET